ncbi:MAG: hypothetical protein IPJ21_16680 [Sterolibacteriaceae bacterium]|nr:hypothetical protein [Sterolibacteriaceae bacterium]MBK9085404.1 hypothetical protein [Sterolibacteriaceae bacterium]
MKRLQALAVLVVLAVANPLPPAAVAADRRADAMREQVRRVQQAQRKAEADRAALEQEKESLQKDKLAAEQALKKSSAESAAIRRTLAGSRQQEESLRQEIEAARKESRMLTDKLADANKHLAETATALHATEQKLAATEGERGALTASLDDQRAATQSCEAKNLKLYEYGRDMLERYQSKGMWATLAQKEPFTGIGRVEIENLLEEYREKLANQRVISSERSAPEP